MPLLPATRVSHISAPFSGSLLPIAMDCTFSLEPLPIPQRGQLSHFDILSDLDTSSHLLGLLLRLPHTLSPDFMQAVAAAFSPLFYYRL